MPQAQGHHNYLFEESKFDGDCGEKSIQRFNASAPKVPKKSCTSAGETTLGVSPFSPEESFPLHRYCSRIALCNYI